MTIQLERAVAAISCVKNWPNITHKCDHTNSCILNGSELKFKLNPRGFGSFLPDKLLVLGDEMPSPSRSDDELAMPEPCYFKIETYLESFVLEK